MARWFATFVLAILCAGCARERPEVVAYTSVDQVFSEPVFREFERQTGIRVRAVYDTEETKSTGVLNRLIAEGAQPQADVFWSGDPVRPFALIQRGFVEPYVSPNAASIPNTFKAADGMWTGFAARARVLLVNTNLVPEAERPRSIRDLAAPRWKGKAAIANPLFGTTTMHAGTLFAMWGDAEAKAFFESLKANDVRIASSNGEVRRLVANGEVSFGLTDTDDANEAIKEGAPVVMVYPDQEDLGALLMPTTTVLMKNAPHADTGRQLIDYLISPEVERRMAESAGHLPVRPDLAKSTQGSGLGDIKPMQVDYSRTATELERVTPWLREWAGM
jgi:iron(III) transport system substrate-binding protein